VADAEADEVEVAGVEAAGTSIGLVELASDFCSDVAGVIPRDESFLGGSVVVALGTVVVVESVLCDPLGPISVSDELSFSKLSNSLDKFLSASGAASKGGAMNPTSATPTSASFVCLDLNI